jgi:hypothetical protein
MELLGSSLVRGHHQHLIAHLSQMLDEVLEAILVPRDVSEGRRLDEKYNAVRPAAPLGVHLVPLQQ